MLHGIYDDILENDPNGSKSTKRGAHGNTKPSPVSVHYCAYLKLGCNRTTFATFNGWLLGWFVLGFTKSNSESSLLQTLPMEVSLQQLHGLQLLPLLLP